ncbi:MAG: hypothetical protein QW609_04250 [Candidatus Aenigmatarchaeota archaeon]
MRIHKIETEYLDILFFTENKEEEKIVKLFRNGKIFLRWNKNERMAEIVPNIFKVKKLNIAIAFKTNHAINEFAKAFMSLWDKGLIHIRYSKELNDIMTSPSVMRFL